MEEPPTWDELGMARLDSHREGGRRSLAFVGVAVLVLTVGLVAWALVDDDQPVAQGPGCFSPPQSEIDASSPVEMEVEPVPVLANTEVMLTVSAPMGEEGASNGLDVLWQCWDGTGWVDTHQMVRGWEGSRPQTVDIGTEIAWEALGLPLPNTHPILVPDVAPGIYRMTERIFTSGDPLVGHVLVEVIVEPEPDPDETVVVTSIPAEPTTTLDPGVTEAAARWQVRGVGMSDQFISSNGRLVLSRGESVFVANGFSTDRNVTAISAGTGDVRWQHPILPEDTFLQAVTDDLLFVNGQFDSLVAVSTDSGATVWTFDLPERYGVVGSVLDEDQIIVAADAQMEGDTRPPLVYALDVDDGDVRWTAELATGTDLQWSSLTIADQVVLIASTPSHQGSAGNMIHAVDTGTGAIRWVRDFGGTQGFHAYPIVVVDSVVMFWAPGDTDELVGLELDTGAELWRAGGIRPLLPTADGRIYGVTGGIVVVEPRTGDAGEVIPDVEDPDSGVMTATTHDGQIVVVGRLWIRGYEIATGSLAWTWTPDEPVVDLAAFGESWVVVPTSEPAVSLIEIP
jgi:outer membrane protein assembly factor BamB